MVGPGFRGDAQGVWLDAQRLGGGLPEEWRCFESAGRRVLRNRPQDRRWFRGEGGGWRVLVRDVTRVPEEYVSYRPPPPVYVPMRSKVSGGTSTGVAPIR